MRTPSSTPSVVVKVSGAMSQCRGDCSYTIANTGLPTMVSASLSTNIITFALDTNTPLPYDVTFADQPCVYLSGDYSNYKCTLPVNANNEPILESGFYLPKVLIINKGYAKYATNLN